MSDDICYTCWEDEDFCECEEGFDSTLEREKTNDFDHPHPASVKEVRELRDGTTQITQLEHAMQAQRPSGRFLLCKTGKIIYK